MSKEGKNKALHLCSVQEEGKIKKFDVGMKANWWRSVLRKSLTKTERCWQIGTYVSMPTFDKFE